MFASRLRPTQLARAACSGFRRAASRAQSGFGRPLPPRPAAVPPTAATEKPRGIVDGSGRIVSSVTPAARPVAGGRPAAASAAAGPASPGAPLSAKRARRPPSAPITDFIVDVTAATFQSAVLEAPVAVLVYFHAAWSEPCAALTPKLEALVRSVPGLVRLAKVDVDANAQLAAALKVSGVPTILGTVGGKSVGALPPGPVPDAQLREFVQGLLAAADGAGMLPGGSGERLSRAADAVVDAHEMVDAGEHAEVRSAVLPPVIAELKGARDRLAEQLASAGPEDPQAAQILAAAGTSGPLYELDDLVARGIAAMVRALLASVADPGADAAALRADAKALVGELRSTYRAHAKQADVRRALAASDLAEGSESADATLEPLLARVRASPGDAELRYSLAEALEAAGQHAAAVDACLELLAAQGAAWGDGKARVLCLRIFEALGAGHPVVAAGRKRLSKLLFR